MDNTKIYFEINIENIDSLIKSYIRAKTEFESAYHKYITKKTNIENIIKYADENENNMIIPYKNYLEEQLRGIKELQDEYNKYRDDIMNLKNEIKSNIVIMNDTLNEIENTIHNSISNTLFNMNDNILLGNEVEGFECREYSCLFDYNLYWRGPYNILVPNNIEYVQSAYSNLYMRRTGEMVIKDNDIGERICIYDKVTYLENYGKNYNGEYVYNK
jgi:hypothetical protein